MSAPWHSVVQKVLDKDDSPVKNFPGKSDKKYGYLVLTKKKLVFVHEKGLFSKTYEVIWETPYSGLEFKQSGRYVIELNGGDVKRVVETGELGPKYILNAIQEAKGNN